MSTARTWQRLLYGLAAESSESHVPSRLPLSSGDTINKRRIHFVNQRLLAIRLRLPPDTHSYMDSDGVRRQVHKSRSPEFDEAAAAASDEVAASTAGKPPALLLTVPNALRPRPPRAGAGDGDGSADERPGADGGAATSCASGSSGCALGGGEPSSAASAALVPALSPPTVEPVAARPAGGRGDVGAILEPHERPVGRLKDEL